ncbi:MAG TPA: AraC family transcriptional regulator [Candidatus Kapabacteria bacterium]|nr:AraC family transcriptional regulator [Candidatus Kapabacteria bacterium]
MDLGHFSARYVATIVTVAELQGLDRNWLLQQLALDEAYLKLSINRVPSIRVIELLHTIIAATGQTCFGLMVGDSFKPGTFDILGLAAMCSNTLREAVLLNHRYQPLNQTLGVSRLEEQGTHAAVVWTPRQQDPEHLRPITEAVMAGYAGIGRWITWHAQQPLLKMEFRHRAPQLTQEYERIFGCEIEFGAARDAILVERSFLDTPLQQADEVTVRVLRRQLDFRLQSLARYESVRHQLAGYLQSQLAREIPSLQRASRALGCSERTLRRRLQQENTSFREILDDVRRICALEYLQRGELELADIAQLLGYQDQSTFTHAFRNWFDVTPGIYRKSLTGGRP